MADAEDALPQRANGRRRRRAQLSEDDGTVASAGDAPSAAPEEDHAGGGSGGGDAMDTAAAPGDAAAADTSGPSLPAYRSARVDGFKFEYLDHTADVQLHAWGEGLKEAFEQCALAMFNYMTPLQHVRQRDTRSYRAEGHDMPSLLYAFLDELLFVFATELFVASSITITTFDREGFVIEAEGRGETFERGMHEAGTEVKAITYSAMSILEHEGDAEVFVIVDI